MKTVIRIFTLLIITTVLITACRNKDAEKRIAQLESRIAELEGQKPANGDPAAPVTATSTTPATETKPEGPLPTMQFEKIYHDFGNIKEGDEVEYTYKFKNTGEVPLVIQGAQGSCGCTVPSWSKDPVPVGGEGFITAKFDSHGKTGFQEKTVTVTANTWPKQTVLKFKAMVAGATPAQ